jgi:hypothetical protein
VPEDPKTGPDKKQRSPRTELELEAAFDVGDARRTAPVTNLSESGLFLQTDAPLSPGVLVDVVPDARSELQLAAEVVRVEADDEGEQRGLGLRFVALDEDSRAEVRRLCDEGSVTSTAERLAAGLIAEARRQGLDEPASADAMDADSLEELPSSDVIELNSGFRTDHPSAQDLAASLAHDTEDVPAPEDPAAGAPSPDEPLPPLATPSVSDVAMRFYESSAEVSSADHELPPLRSESAESYESDGRYESDERYEITRIPAPLADALAQGADVATRVFDGARARVRPLLRRPEPVALEAWTESPQDREPASRLHEDTDQLAGRIVTAGLVAAFLLIAVAVAMLGSRVGNLEDELWAREEALADGLGGIAGDVARMGEAHGDLAGALDDARVAAAALTGWSDGARITVEPQVTAARVDDDRALVEARLNARNEGVEAGEVLYWRARVFLGKARGAGAQSVNPPLSRGAVSWKRVAGAAHVGAGVSPASLEELAPRERRALERASTGDALDSKLAPGASLDDALSWVVPARRAALVGVVVDVGLRGRDGGVEQRRFVRLASAR